MEVRILVQLQAVDERERGLGVACLGDRGGSVELDDRRARAARELAVQGRELVPVLRVVGVQARDRRLQDVRAATAQRQRAVEHGSAFRDLRRVPERPVLVGEQHERAVGEARLTPGVVQQHERLGCRRGEGPARARLVRIRHVK